MLEFMLLYLFPLGQALPETIDLFSSLPSILFHSLPEEGFPEHHSLNKICVPESLPQALLLENLIKQDILVFFYDNLTFNLINS